VPPGNPYVGHPGRDEIFAYAFLNPRRFPFDRHRIAIGDVGVSQREELDYTSLPGAKGANFGWPAWEGDRRHRW
jgi:hypothetical protein